jgi:hypothetical protein
MNRRVIRQPEGKGESRAAPRRCYQRGGLPPLSTDSPLGIPRSGAREKSDGRGRTRVPARRAIFERVAPRAARSVRKSIFQAPLRENAQRLSRTCLTDGIQTLDSGNTAGEHSARARARNSAGYRQR